MWFLPPTAPKYLLRDRDSICGSGFVQRVEGLRIKQRLISFRSPWQSPYVERLVGSIRRECLDQVIVFNERQLRQILKSCFKYYLEVRPHRSLDHDSPVPRPLQSPDCGNVIEMPLVGGLHHRYFRQAA
jgi:putative transposase